MGEVNNERIKLVVKRLAKSSTPDRVYDDVQLESMRAALIYVGGTGRNGVARARKLLSYGNFDSFSWKQAIEEAEVSEERATKALTRATRRMPRLQKKVDTYTEALAQSKKVKAEDRVARFTRELAVHKNAIDSCPLDVAEAEQALKISRARTAVLRKIAKCDADGPEKVVRVVYQLLDADKGDEFLQQLRSIQHD